jgi:hypothetical protein
MWPRIEKVTQPANRHVIVFTTQVMRASLWAGAAWSSRVWKQGQRNGAVRPDRPSVQCVFPDYNFNIRHPSWYIHAKVCFTLINSTVITNTYTCNKWSGYRFQLQGAIIRPLTETVKNKLYAFCKRKTPPSFRITYIYKNVLHVSW